MTDPISAEKITLPYLDDYLLFLKTQTSRDTLCIVAVHLFGIPCDIESISKICEEKRSKNFRFLDGLKDAFGNRAFVAGAD